MLTSSVQREMRQFQKVVVQWQQRNVRKKRYARAKLLRSLLSSSLLEPPSNASGQQPLRTKPSTLKQIRFLLLKDTFQISFLMLQFFIFHLIKYNVSLRPKFWRTGMRPVLTWPPPPLPSCLKIISLPWTLWKWMTNNLSKGLVLWNPCHHTQSVNQLLTIAYFTVKPDTD